MKNTMQRYGFFRYMQQAAIKKRIYLIPFNKTGGVKNFSYNIYPNMKNIPYL